MKRDTHRLALAAMLSALGAVLLCLGGILPLSTYACPVLASLAVAAAREECGGKYGFGCYAVTAAIALLLSPDKEAAALFAFLGYYPLLKPRLDALRPAALRAAAKLALCAVAVGAMYALLIFLLRLEALTRELGYRPRAAARDGRSGPCHVPRLRSGAGPADGGVPPPQKASLTFDGKRPDFLGNRGAFCCFGRRINTRWSWRRRRR